MASKKRVRHDPAATEAAEEAFLDENGDNLVEVDRTEGFDASRDVLERLIMEGVDDTVLVRAIAVCANQHELFAHLVRNRTGTPCWGRFVETVLLIPEDVWEKGNGDGDLSEDLVAPLINDDMLARIARPRNDAHREMREHLTSSNHPLFCAVDFSPYWKSSTQYYVRRGDFWRAWDMIRKAHRGFFMPNREEDAQESGNYAGFRQDPANRCCMASKLLLQVLVSELFEAMVHHKVIEPLGERDYDAPPDKVYKVRWARTRAGRRRRRYLEDNPYPAKALILAVGGTYYDVGLGGRVPDPVKTPQKFQELSAEANKIAQHFRRGEMTEREADRKTA